MDANTLEAMQSVCVTIFGVSLLFALAFVYIATAKLDEKGKESQPQRPLWTEIRTTGEEKQ